VIVGFILVVGAGLRASLQARSEFSKLVGLGLTVTIGFQAFLIIAGDIRVLPLTAGFTLPFVSYGGSALVANYVLIALLMRISHESAEPRPRTRGSSRGLRAERKRNRAATRAPAPAG